MSNLKLALYGLINSIAVSLYTVLVAWVLMNGNQIFGAKPGILGLAAFLMLFVLSAAIVGTLIFGKPVILYVNGLRSSAIKLFFYTVAWLVVVTLGIIIYHIWK